MISNETLLERAAGRIHVDITKIIIEKNLIDTAVDTPEPGTPMEFLYDVYVEFIDPSGNTGPFSCPKCRQTVLHTFYQLKPYLEKQHAK